MADGYEELDFNNAEKLVRQRQTFARKPKSSADVVAFLMARKGYAQQKSATEIQETWDVVAGESWRTQTKAGQIRRGALEVIVGNSVLHQRLEFEKKRLLNELKNLLPNIKLTDIRFRIGNV